LTSAALLVCSADIALPESVALLLQDAKTVQAGLGVVGAVSDMFPEDMSRVIELSGGGALHTVQLRRPLPSLSRSPFASSLFPPISLLGLQAMHTSKDKCVTTYIRMIVLNRSRPLHCAPVKLQYQSWGWGHIAVHILLCIPLHSLCLAVCLACCLASTEHR
jgi:hypothetical protein